MNRDTVKSLREDIDKALEEIGAEYDLTIKITGSMSFNESSCRGKFEAYETKEDGTVYDPARQAFINNASYYGLSSDDLGKTFVSQGRTFRITGLKPSRPKYPISAEDVVSQKRFKFSASHVKRLLDGGV